MAKPTLPTKGKTTPANDVEPSSGGLTTNLTLNNFTQPSVDKLQALCNELIQNNKDDHGIYAHMILYLQQFGGTTLALSSQQHAVLQTLIRDAFDKGMITSANKTTLLAAVK